MKNDLKHDFLLALGLLAAAAVLYVLFRPGGAGAWAVVSVGGVETARQLRQRYEVFRSASEVARNTLECNLRAMEKIQQAQAEPEESGQADFRA